MMIAAVGKITLDGHCNRHHACFRYRQKQPGRWPISLFSPRHARASWQRRFLSFTRVLGFSLAAHIKAAIATASSPRALPGQKQKARIAILHTRLNALSQAQQNYRPPMPLSSLPRVAFSPQPYRIFQAAARSRIRNAAIVEAYRFHAATDITQYFWRHHFACARPAFSRQGF